MGEESGRLPRLRLDELVDELQVRIDAMRGNQRRVHSLLEALLSIGRELDQPQVLRQIAESAVELVDAKYAVLGGVEGTRPAQYVTVGGTEEGRKAVGAAPSENGVPGGLGVPIRVRGELFGNLCLAEKRGGGEFDSEDENVLRTLAMAAGVAIENARLYKIAQDGQQWMAANAEVVEELLSGTEEMDVLHGIVRHAGSILRADLGALALPMDGGGLRVVIATGVGAEKHHGLVLPLEGTFMGAAIVAGKPITTDRIGKDPRATAGPPRWEGLGPVVAVPMTSDGGARGALLLARREEADCFVDDEVAPLLAFAGQAALAMELAERRRSAEQMALLEDRDRIARDLHDLAIQRLFATGMTLQSALRFVDRPEAADRLLRAVDELDETIKIIRSTIFGLRTEEAEHRPRGLRSRATASAQEAARTLGFTPALHMEGLLDTDVPPPVVEDVIAVLVEALSNTARHAQATAAEVSLCVADATLTVAVTDNGIGLSSLRHRSGLRNLAERAERRGGRLETGPGPHGGTRLVWRVPLAVA